MRSSSDCIYKNGMWCKISGSHCEGDDCEDLELEEDYEDGEGKVNS